MDALAQYFHMGGYATFVWSAYGIAFVGMLGSWLYILHTLNKRQREFDTVKRDRAGETA